jgi:hypothetical protein
MKTPRYRVFKSKNSAMPVFSTNWQFLAEAYVKVEDYYPSGERFFLRFRQKGGKEKELPVHHKLEQLLDQYLKATELENEPEAPLFPAAIGKTGKLSRRPLVWTDTADMLKRPLKQGGLPAHYSPHSFRASGITNFLRNDGTLEAAQRNRRPRRQPDDETLWLRAGISNAEGVQIT